MAIDRLPFWPAWALLFAIWMSIEYRGTKVSALELVFVFGLAVGLAVVPIFPLLAAGALVIWALGLALRTCALILRSISLPEDPKRQVRGHVIMLIALAATAAVCLWGWDRPSVAVRRLGSGRMAESARHRLLQLHTSGYDLGPLLLEGLAGDGHYWLQASDVFRQIQILEFMRQLHDPRGVSSAARLLRAGDPYRLLQPAAKYLAEIGGPESVESLIDFGESHPIMFEQGINEALQQATGQDFGENWERWRSWQRERFGPPGQAPGKPSGP